VQRNPDLRGAAPGFALLIPGYSFCYSFFTYSDSSKPISGVVPVSTIGRLMMLGFYLHQRDRALFVFDACLRRGRQQAPGRAAPIEHVLPAECRAPLRK